MAQQKRSRGNGSNLEMAEIRLNNQGNFITFLAELFAILRDVLTGNLAIREIPIFIVWMWKKGGAAGGQRHAQPRSGQERTTLWRPGGRDAVGHSGKEAE